MFAMAPGQCCCSCQDCCNGSFADEWDVDVTFGASTCASSPFCDFASGTFTAQKLGGCAWVYEYLNPQNILDGPDCDTYSPWYLDSFSIAIRVNCINDTQYAVVAEITLSAQREVPCFGVVYYMSTIDTIRYSTIVNSADFDCTAEVDFELQKAYHLTQFQGVACRYGWIYGPLCSSPATLKITAVP